MRCFQTPPHGYVPWGWGAGGGGGEDSKDVRDLFPSEVAKMGKGMDFATFLAGGEQQSTSATLPSGFSPEEA